MKWVGEHFDRLTQQQKYKNYECHACKYDDNNPDFRDEKKRAYQCERRCGPNFRQKWGEVEKESDAISDIIYTLHDSVMELEAGCNPYIPEILKGAVGTYKMRLHKYITQIAVCDGYIMAQNKIYAAADKQRKK